MRRYSQSTLLHPQRTLAIWLGLIAAAAIAVTLVPGSRVTFFRPGAAGETLELAAGVLAVIVVVMAVALRSWQGVAAAVGVVVAALAVSYALTSLVGVHDIPLAPALIFVAAFGLQASLYIGCSHRERLHTERRRARPLPRDRRYLLSEAVRDVRSSVVLSTICNMALFATVYFFATGELHRLAGFMVIAIASTGIAAMTILPGLFAVFPVAAPDRDALTDPATGMAARISAVCARHPRLILAVAAGLVGVAATAIVQLDVAGTGSELSAPWSLAAPVISIWVLTCIGVTSFRHGTLALVPALPPALLVYALVVLGHRSLDVMTAMTAAVVLGLVTDHTVHLVKAWNAHHAHGPGHGDPAPQALAQVSRPLVWSSLAVALCAATMGVVRDDHMTWSGLVLAVAMMAALGWQLACRPAILALYRKRPSLQPRADDWAIIKSFHKVTASEQNTSFSEFTDDQIRNMFVGDFLALCGKTVIRHGGTHGTRRLLAEVDIQPDSRVLEIGTGVGTTAFDLVAADPTVHVTGIDLSAFMVETTRRRAAQLPADQSSRLTFVHTRDPNAMPFEDNTFDVVIVEAVASYNDPPKFFREILRVLKPGGRIGLHDWCWTEQPTEDLEVHVCVLACGCNPGDMKFFTQADWAQHLDRQGLEVRFAEQYAFTFFSWGTMADDEGTWRLVKMFARVLSRRAVAQRMLRMTALLARHEGAFGYTITVGRKPLADAPSVAEPVTRQLSA